MESCKIDILYHATTHFEVRKFVHNAKPEELSYDYIVEVAKAHERTCQEYQIAHSGALVNYQILWFKQVLCLSFVRNTIPRRSVADVDAHTTTEIV